MKKIFFSLIVLSFMVPVGVVLAVAPPIDAVDFSKPPVDAVDTSRKGSDSTKLQNPLKVDSIEGVILLAANIAIYIGVALAILVIIFIGFRYVLAQGKPEEIKKVHAWFMWTIIGLAVLISAGVIVEIVKTTLIDSGVVKKEAFLKP